MSSDLNTNIHGPSRPSNTPPTPDVAKAKAAWRSDLSKAFGETPEPGQPLGSARFRFGQRMDRHAKAIGYLFIGMHVDRVKDAYESANANIINKVDKEGKTAKKKLKTVIDLLGNRPQIRKDNIQSAKQDKERVKQALKDIPHNQREAQIRFDEAKQKLTKAETKWFKDLSKSELTGDTTDTKKTEAKVKQAKLDLLQAANNVAETDKNLNLLNQANKVKQGKENVRVAELNVDQAMQECYSDKEELEKQRDAFKKIKNNYKYEYQFIDALKENKTPIADDKKNDEKWKPLEEAKNKWLQAKLDLLKYEKSQKEIQHKFPVQTHEQKLLYAKPMPLDIKQLQTEKAALENEIAMQKFKMGMKVALASVAAVATFVVAAPALIILLPIIGLGALIDASEYARTKVGFVGLHDHKDLPTREQLLEQGEPSDEEFEFPEMPTTPDNPPSEEDTETT